MSAFSAKVLFVVQALVVMTTLARAEGEGPRSRSKSLARQETQIQRPDQALLAEHGPVSEAAKRAQCDKSEAGWRSWRDRRIAQLLRLEPKSTSVSEPYLDDSRVMKRSTKIFNMIHECVMLGLPPPDSVLGNLTDFVTAQHNADFHTDLKHQFGHHSNDYEYLKSAKAQLELPCLLKNPRFLHLISDPKSYYQAWKLIELHNHEGVTDVLNCPTNGEKWTVLIYRSRFLPTPDYAETFGRFFVLVKGQSDEDYDRWIQFGIWLPEDKTKRPGEYGSTIHNLSVVSIARGRDPRADKRFDALADWWRVAKDGQSGLELQFRRLTPPYETDNCIRCHKTLPIGIHPQSTYEFDAQGELVKSPPATVKAVTVADTRGLGDPSPADVVAGLNKYVFDTYLRPPIYEIDDGDTIASARNYGPKFGPVMTRSVESLRACTHGLKPDSVTKVMAGMNCAGCHNDTSGVGMLNYPLATEKRVRHDSNQPYANLISSHIHSGIMPLGGQSLSIPEKTALYSCLSEEYFKPAPKSKNSTGLFVDWLKQKPAPSPLTAHS